MQNKWMSRKFWAALIAAVMAVMVSLFSEEMGAPISQTLGNGIHALIAYIFGESAVDIAGTLSQKKEF